MDSAEDKANFTFLLQVIFLSQGLNPRLLCFAWWDCKESDTTEHLSMHACIIFLSWPRMKRTAVPEWICLWQKAAKPPRAPEPKVLLPVVTNLLALPPGVDFEAIFNNNEH